MFAADGFSARHLTRDDLGELQRFFERNPEYSQIVGGEPPSADRARELFESQPPPEWPRTGKWVVGVFDEGGALVGVVDVIADLFVEGLWHLGLFIVATERHGSGLAHSVYAELEQWMQKSGAHWLRLGVVVGNRRAERFWERVGYRDVRIRTGVAVGQRVNSLRVMVKLLDGSSIEQYLAAIERDRPEAP